MRQPVHCSVAFALLSLLSPTSASAAQPTSAAAVPGAPGPAEIARLALDSPLVVHVRATRAKRVAGAPAGFDRFAMEGRTVALIKGAAGLPAELRWLADLPRNGTAPAARPRGEFLLFAAPLAEQPGVLRLVYRDGQRAWDEAIGQRLRALLAEAAAPAAPPAIAALVSAIHVPGTLPGESETRFFLQAADGRPLSLNVTRRPGEEPAWSVALGEVVDQAAPPPAHGGLLWYRLACGLPAALPDAALEQPEHAGAVRADYALIRDALGPCR